MLFVLSTIGIGAAAFVIVSRNLLHALIANILLLVMIIAVLSLRGHAQLALIVLAFSGGASLLLYGSLILLLNLKKTEIPQRKLLVTKSLVGILGAFALLQLYQRLAPYLQVLKISNFSSASEVVATPLPVLMAYYGPLFLVLLFFLAIVMVSLLTVMRNNR